MMSMRIWHEVFSIRIFLSVLILSVAVFSFVSPEGLFRLETKTATSLSSPLPLDITNMISSIKVSNDPKTVLLATYNKVNGDNLAVTYPLDVKDMNKQVFYEQMILLYKLNGIQFNESILEELNETIYQLNDTLVSAVALIISATNNATILVNESFSKLNETEKRLLSNVSNMTNYTQSEILLLNSISAKINKKKMAIASAYVLDAQAKAIPYLKSYAKSSESQSDSVDAYEDANCGSLNLGLVYGSGYVFHDNSCTVVIGGVGSQRYGVRTSYGGYSNSDYPWLVAIDLGGDDFYAGHVGHGDPNQWHYVGDYYAGTQVIGVGYVRSVLDIAGNDFYAHADTANCLIGPCPAWGGGAGSAYSGIGIVNDLAGNDYYWCQRTCQGGGIAGGIGILNDAAGSDNYICNNLNCQGFGATGGIGILNDIGMEVNYADCGRYEFSFIYCQGASFGGVGVMAIGGANTVLQCKSYCQGYSFFGNSFLISYNQNTRYICDQLCQGYTEGLSGPISYLLDLAGADTYICNHDCQGTRTLDSISSGTVTSTGVVWDADLSYQRFCNYNCGLFVNEQVANILQNDPSELIPSIPVVNGPYTCTQIIPNGVGANYNVGAYVYVNGVKYGQCVSGGASVLPLSFQNIPTRINPMTNGTIIITNCDWAITQQNLGSTNTNDYISNCKVGNTVNIPITTVNLPFYDNFDWCNTPNCALAGTQSAIVSTIPYSYSNAPSTAAWYAFSGQDAHTAGSIRSGSIGHNKESRLSFSVTLPALQDRAAVYFLSFNYKVVGEPKDVLQLLATKRPQINLGPLGTLENPNGVACLIAPGQVDSINQWSTFNAVPDPSNECSHMTPGEYTFDFIYKKDSSLSALPDAAFIDNLQINLIPVGP